MKAIIFDCDGTLLDTIGNNKMIRFIDVFLFQKAMWVHDLGEAINSLKWKVNEIEGVFDKVKTLKNNGAVVGVLTDGSTLSSYLRFCRAKEVRLEDFDFIQTRKSWVNFFLKKKQIHPNHFICSFSKPNPKVFNQIINWLKSNYDVDKEEIIYIGDMPKDREAAAKANIRFVEIENFRALDII